MNRACVLVALLTLLLPSWSWAQDSTAQPEEYTRSVWLYPVPAIYMAAVFRSPTIPVGVSAAVSESVDLVFEVTISLDAPQYCIRSAYGIWAAVGASFHALSTHAQGFFVQPKLVFRYFSGGNKPLCNDSVGPREPDGELGIGADLGYRWTLRRVRLEAVVGAQLGYCMNCFGSDFPGYSFWPATAQKANQFRVQLNPNLLRVGLAF